MSGTLTSEGSACAALGTGIHFHPREAKGGHLLHAVMHINLCFWGFFGFTFWVPNLGPKKGDSFFGSHRLFLMCMDCIIFDDDGVILYDRGHC